ncbi:YifB family Mg chelatase-like AAA ATPase [Fusibacter sp. JL298sf-3]
MYSRIHTAVLDGLDGRKIEIESQVTNGLPYYTLVGLPNQVIKESKERVRSALRASGLPYPDRRLTQNLYPAHLKKEGAHLDLPLAVGILATVADFRCGLETIGFLGALSLDGSIRRINGVLGLVEGLRAGGIKQVVIPEGNLEEVASERDMTFFTCASIAELYRCLQSDTLHPVSVEGRDTTLSVPICPDFSDVIGQPHAVKGAMLSALGGHHLLLIGPPGCGKSMLAERLPALLPLPDDALSKAIRKVNSFLGGESGVLRRPVVHVHQSVSKSGLIGGHNTLAPGLITRAHGGVLLLDEVNRFKSDVLEALREPMSNRNIVLTRRHRTVRYPADFLLVGTMNPCHCGYHLSAQKACICPAHVLDRYKMKLSGPLVDRIHLVVYMDVSEEGGSQSTAALLEKLHKARAFKSAHPILKWSEEAENRLQRYHSRGRLSARRLKAVKAVAESLAYLALSECVEVLHLLEAISYQDVDRLRR